MTAVAPTNPDLRFARPLPAAGRAGPPPRRKLQTPRPDRLPVPAHELHGGKVDGALLSRAVWEEPLLAACEYVREYEAAQGLSNPHHPTPCVGLAEAMPETALYVARAGDEILGVQRVVVENETVELPSSRSFALELRSLRGRARRLCEASPPATAPEFQKSDLLFEFVRCSVAHCITLCCTDLITAVEPWDVERYAAMGFRACGKPRILSRMSPFPAVLMAMRVDALAGVDEPSGAAAEQTAASLRDAYAGRNPYRSFVKVWTDLAEGAFDDAVFLGEVFARRGRLLSRYGPRTLQAVRRRWGARLFDQVFGPSATSQFRADTSAPQFSTAASADSIDDGSLDTQMVFNERG